jgi:hypothetical protein
VMWGLLGLGEAKLAHTSIESGRCIVSDYFVLRMLAVNNPISRTRILQLLPARRLSTIERHARTRYKSNLSPHTFSAHSVRRSTGKTATTMSLSNLPIRTLTGPHSTTDLNFIDERKSNMETQKCMSNVHKIPQCAYNRDS